MANPFAETGSKIVEVALSSILYIGIAVLLIGALSAIMYWFVFYKRKFNIEIKITSSRSGDKDYVFYDKGAILIDRKTKTKFLKFWSLKLELPTPPFEILQTTSRGDLIELYRESENNFYFLEAPKINKKQVIKADGKLYGQATQSQNRMDADIEFWNQKRKFANKKMFDTESMFMKILPFIPLIISSVIQIFVLYILLDHLPGILSQLTKLVQELRVYKQAEIITSGWIMLMLKWK